MKLNINGNTVEVADEELTKAIEAKTETIEVKSDLVIRSVADEKTFSDNIRTEGITAGTDIGRKEVLKGFGIEGEGLHKSDKTAIDAIQTFSNGLVTKALEDAKIEPDKKNEELTKDITTLKGTIETLTKSNEDQAANFKTFKNNQLISNSLSGQIPENALLGTRDTLTIMNAQIKLDVNEHGVVFGVGADGNPLKDKTTLELLPVKTIVTDFFNDNAQLLKPSSGGGGGGDSSGADGKQTTDEFIKEMGDLGHAPNSPKFNEIMQERIKAETLVV